MVGRGVIGLKSQEILRLSVTFSPQMGKMASSSYYYSFDAIVRESRGCHRDTGHVLRSLGELKFLQKNWVFVACLLPEKKKSTYTQSSSSCDNQPIKVISELPVFPASKVVHADSSHVCNGKRSNFITIP